MKKLLAIILIVALIGCTGFSRRGHQKELNAYEGDGDLEFLVRLSSGKETYGYVLQFPKFVADAKIKRKYKLTGLPLWDQIAKIELATFVPIFWMPIKEANRKAPIIPKEHKINCKLIEMATGMLITEFQGEAATLDGSHSLQFNGATFIRHMFRVDLGNVPSAKNLQLILEYDPDGMPIEAEMQVILIVDAPGA
jgi:hypothetical protein